jgi:zinc protease
VDKGLASSLSGALAPTQHPFLYTISITATDGTPLRVVEDATLGELERVRQAGVTPQEVDRAKTQLRARLVFEGDSVTNIAHQLGHFETIASWRLVPTLRERIDAVTVDDVRSVAAARLLPARRTVAWFEPQPIT